MKKFQEELRIFDKERNWEQFRDPKDLLLGIVEEVGELRNFIKWERDPEIINKIINDNKAEMEDGIADLLWCVLLLANRFDVDAEKAMQDVIEANKKRFPVEIVKGKNTNLYTNPRTDLKYVNKD